MPRSGIAGSYGKYFSSGLFQRKRYSVSNSNPCCVLHPFPSCQSFYSMSCLFKLLLSAIHLISLVKNKLISNNNHGEKKSSWPFITSYSEDLPQNFCEGASALNIFFTQNLLFKSPQLGFDLYQSMENTVGFFPHLPVLF